MKNTIHAFVKGEKLEVVALDAAENDGISPAFGDALPFFFSPRYIAIYIIHVNT